MGSHSTSPRRVKQLSIDGQHLKTFESSRAAAFRLKLDNSTISKCCLGKRHSHGGYKWEYYN